MKKKFTLTFIFILASLLTYAQSKGVNVHYNKLISVKGTEYCIATVENRTKVSTVNSFLLFINSATGENKSIGFPEGANIQSVQQIKLDTLSINKILIIAGIVDLDGKDGIDWGDPKQILICSPDGSDLKQMTDSSYYINTWMINENTGTLIVAGYYDTNNNRRNDKDDKSEVVLIDLKTVTVKHRF